MQELTELQEQVLKKAKRRLKEEYGHEQVCTDQLGTDAEIQQDFDGAVEEIFLDTCYWDNLGPFRLRILDE